MHRGRNDIGALLGAVAGDDDEDDYGGSYLGQDEEARQLDTAAFKDDSRVHFGPPLSVPSTMGVVRTAFHLYKRLLQAHWKAEAYEKSGDFGAFDDYFYYD